MLDVGEPVMLSISKDLIFISIRYQVASTKCAIVIGSIAKDLID